MSLAAASKHVQVLERAGLLRRTVAGRRHVCSLERAQLASAAEWLRFSEPHEEPLAALEALLRHEATPEREDEMTAERAAVRLRRTIFATPDRVYRAWLDPDLLRRWLAPPGFVVTRVEVDERPGGRWRVWLGRRARPVQRAARRLRLRGHHRRRRRSDPVRAYLREIGRVPAAHRRRGDRARQAHRAQRPGRPPPADRGQPASRGVGREALRRPRHALPRPHPGGQHRPHARRREVTTGVPATGSRPTRPGGSARRSRAASPTRRARSACPCTWSRRSTSCTASSAT